MQIKTITQPTGEPVTALECWRHLRLDQAYDSPPPSTVPEAAMIAAYLSAAREWAEAYTGLSLVPKTLEVSLDNFPGWRNTPYGGLVLPRGPVQSITSITYTDTAGNAQTVSSGNYTLKDYEGLTVIVPTFGTFWPSAYFSHDAVRVRYVAGYSLPTDSPQSFPLPPSIKAALLLLMADSFENREITVIGNIVEAMPRVENLLWPHRVGTGL